MRLNNLPIYCLRNYLRFGFLIASFVCAQLLLADQPMLSSKAIRVALKAKESIQDPSSAHVEEAVSSLESLLEDASFLRLDPSVQVDILLLLSRGYDRLEEFTRQERFLLKYAKKRELYRYHILLKTALVRSYIHQDRIFEAEHLLEKLAKPSLAYSALEEKTEIAKTIIFTEDALRSILISAEVQAKNGLLREALKKYKTVLSSLEKYFFPFQASPVEKMRLQYCLLTRMAELYYLLNDYEHALLTLSNWPSATAESPGIRPFFEKRDFLLTLIKPPHDPAGEPQACFLQKKEPYCTPQGTNNESPEYLSWQAHQAIIHKDIDVLSNSIYLLTNKKNEGLKSLIYILEGFREALCLRMNTAYEALEKGTATQNSWTLPWKEASLNLLGELGLQRALILACSNQEASALRLSSQLIERLGTHPLSDSLQELVSLLRDRSETSHQDTSCLLSFAKRQSCPWPWNTSPYELYLDAITAYQECLAGSLSEEKALSSLELALTQVPDALPQLLSYRIELLVREGSIGDAYGLALSLLQKYPEYPRTPSSILLCLINANAFPAESQVFEKFLYEKPLSAQALFLTFRLFETKKEIPEYLPEVHKEILFSLRKREEARKYVMEVSKSKEAGFIKDRIEQACTAFDEARAKIKPLLASSQSILTGYLLSLYTEEIDALEKTLTSPFAFNELPVLLAKTTSTLSEDLIIFKTDHIDSAFLQECSALKTTADLYTHAFSRDFDAVLALVKNSPDSLLRTSRSANRAILFAAKGLRESHRNEDAHALLSHLDETTLKEIHYELALEVAIEKSLILREMKQTRKAMSLLAWVINSPCVSSLRIKAMVVRADMYLAMNREELAIKQLESVVCKGGEWGAVAERKLRELQKGHGSC